MGNACIKAATKAATKAYGDDYRDEVLTSKIPPQESCEAYRRVVLGPNVLSLGAAGSSGAGKSQGSCFLTPPGQRTSQSERQQTVSLPSSLQSQPVASSICQQRRHLATSPVPQQKQQQQQQRDSSVPPPSAPPAGFGRNLPLSPIRTRQHVSGCRCRKCEPNLYSDDGSFKSLRSFCKGACAKGCCCCRCLNESLPNSARSSGWDGAKRTSSYASVGSYASSISSGSSGQDVPVASNGQRRQLARQRANTTYPDRSERERQKSCECREAKERQKLQYQSW